MQITICDDEVDERTRLKEFISLFSKETGQVIHTVEYASGEELLSHDLSEIILLDIQMDGINGMDTAREIRKRSEDVCIIFITNMIQFAIEGYEVAAFRFIQKGQSYLEFKHVLEGAIKNLKQREGSSIVIKHSGGVEQIKTKEIKYVETLRGQILLHMKDKTVPCALTMSAIEKELKGEPFFRCHTGFLVALSSVEQYLGKDVRLKDGTLIPVSKHRKNQFLGALTDYWGGLFL